MAYCDYMRRRINFEADSSEEVRGKMAELRTVFTRARSHLNKCELVSTVNREYFVSKIFRAITFCVK